VLYQGPPDLCYSDYESRPIGLKNYEITDHLGNPRVIISDWRLEQYTFNKLATPPNISHSGLGLMLDPIEMNNYYPFGMLKSGMTANLGDSYRYGFNSYEKDDEIKGLGNSIDFGARIYDPRLGRFKSIDPLGRLYPDRSHYLFAGNSPIAFIDKGGLLDGYFMAETQAEHLGSQAESTTLVLAAAAVQISQGAIDAPTYFLTSFDDTFGGVSVTGEGDGKAYRFTWENGFHLHQPYDPFYANLDEHLTFWGGAVEVVAPMISRVSSLGLTLSQDLINPSKWTAHILGELGETGLAKAFSGTRRVYKTTPSGSKRVIDLFDETNKIAYEAKIGYKGASKFIKKQFSKDLELLDEGQLEEVVWIFYESPKSGKSGASGPLLEMFKEAQKKGYNIRTEIHTLKDEAFDDIIKEFPELIED
jgi:RHS repeat-associated protein